MKREDRPIARLEPARVEVARPRGGRAGYVWVDGYNLHTPDGTVIPGMRRSEARAHARRMGWQIQEQDRRNK